MENWFFADVIVPRVGESSTASRRREAKERIAIEEQGATASGVVDAMLGTSRHHVARQRRRSDRVMVLVTSSSNMSSSPAHQSHSGGPDEDEDILAQAAALLASNSRDEGADSFASPPVGAQEANLDAVAS